MGRKKMDLNHPAYRARFEVLLESILHRQQNPLKRSAEALGGRKIGDAGIRAGAAAYRPVLRLLNHLLDQGIVEMAINKRNLSRQSQSLSRLVDERSLNLTRDQAETLAFLADVKQVKVQAFSRQEDLYAALGRDLGEALRDDADGRVLVGAGKTVNALKDHFQPEEALIEKLRTNKEGVFYPCAGNFSTKLELRPEEYEYFYQCSANSNAMRLNEKLRLPTLYFDIPALIEMPRPSRPGEVFSEEKTRKYLSVLKAYFQNSKSYRRIYRAHARISTVLFSVNIFNPAGASGARTSYSSVLRQYHENASFQGVTSEILLRFYKNETLMGTREIRKIPLGSDLSQGEVFDLFHFCYLGLTDEFCRKTAAEHRRTGRGLGSVLVVLNDWKMPSTALASCMANPIVNRVYLMKAHLDELRAQIQKLETPRREWKEWAEKKTT